MQFVLNPGVEVPEFQLTATILALRSNSLTELWPSAATLLAAARRSLSPNCQPRANRWRRRRPLNIIAGDCITRTVTRQWHFAAIALSVGEAQRLL